MKTFKIIYEFNHSRMGFQNQITVESDNEENALQMAKEAVLKLYGAPSFKKFTFKVTV